MSTHLRYPDVLVTNPVGQVRTAAWMSRFEARVTSEDEVTQYSGSNAVVVVQSLDVATVLRRTAFIKALAERVQGAGSFRVVFSFARAESGEGKRKWLVMRNLLSHFPRSAAVAVTGPGAGEDLVVQAEVAKAILHPRDPRPRSEPVDPVGTIKSVIRATAKLRSQAGRLDAEKVAGLFGVTTAEIASLVGRSRQSVSKTPDAASLQKALRPFERICRLNTILEPRDFRAWLNQPSDQLDGLTPLEVIREGKPAVVADFAEDILTGAPA